MKGTLFLFIDESGNFDFSSKGTKYFVLSCLSTFMPVKERGRLIKLRYELLANGVDQEYFHATEDAQAIRDRVFELINSLSDDIEIHSVVAQKNKANPSLYKEEYFKKGKRIERIVGAEFYQRVCQTLLQYVFRRSNFQKATRIVVVLGSIFTRDRQSLILKTLKKYLKENFAMPFEIYFHSSQADLNCQYADYFGWAIAIRWERSELRSYILIKSKVKSEYEIFKRGETLYYQYKN
ncbi:hypothetical protein A2115_03600 [Candidatus Woesebacteria bacterium GWA1_41_8]|uniref:DUF3800 domain-containing protein n=1 Tax=Candidatus Woesebacteria bacterium GWA1_41_8 TaxID=1802471 RepID=A0A1F7WI92_9BACT|nr:MAG: hypothetical protein A2115_03600 [Candidatus Woesebacteria bacterium GWA1_41_8]